jgi:hypothetical protein
VDIGFIILGLLLIAGSRVFADGFRVRGDTSAVTKFSGLGDDYSSRIYRWITAVVTGLVFLLVGIADLFGG